MSKPLAASASAMSDVVTDPYSASVSPTRRVMTTSTLASRSACASTTLRSSASLASNLARSRSITFLLPVGGEQGELARQQVVARVAVGDLHDFAAPTEIVDVVSKNDFHFNASPELRNSDYRHRPTDTGNLQFKR